MFNGCSSLKELNISNFNTNNAISLNGMLSMFSRCSDEFKKKIKSKYKNINDEVFYDALG